MCFGSALGYGKGLLKTLFWIITILLSVFISYFLLPVVINLIMPLFDSVNINLFGLNEILNNVLNSQNSLILFVKLLLRLENYDEITFKLVLLSLVTLLILFFVVKKIIKKILKNIREKLKSGITIAKSDRLFGTFAGLGVSLIVCCLLSFIVSGINYSGIFGDALSNEVLNSSLLTYFDKGFNVIVETFKNMQ